MSTHLFAEKYKDYPQDELYEIIERSNVYGEFARLGAIQVLEERNGTSEELEQLKNLINKIEYTSSDEESPQLYSKLLIRMFALFFGTLFGMILLMYNMKVTKNQTGRIQVLIFGILYMVMSYLLIREFDLDTNYSILINLIGGLILTEYFWNKFIGKTTQYMTKNWIKPTLITLALVVPISYIYLNQIGLI